MDPWFLLDLIMSDSRKYTDTIDLEYNISLMILDISEVSRSTKIRDLYFIRYLSHERACYLVCLTDRV